MVQNDVVIRIRNTADEFFELVDAQTLEHLAGPFPSLTAAVKAARSYTTGKVHYRTLDQTAGRHMGDPPHSSH